MSDFQVLTAVRSHLLHEGVAPYVHLALPPKATYPLILLELEEIWSSYPFKEKEKRRDVQARVKFKVSAYSQNPGMEEAAYLSDKIRRTLEGATLLLPGVREGDKGGHKTSTIRFLACVTEVSGKTSGGHHLRVIHHFYDCIVRG